MQESAKKRYLLFDHWPKPTLRLAVWFFFICFMMAEGAIIRHVANMDILDARICYRPAQAVTLIGMLSPSSKAAYRAFNIVDFSFIFFYSIMLVAWFRVLAPDAGGKFRSWHWLGLVPGVFDLIETTGVALLLRSGQPEQSAGIWLAVIGTPLKWLGVVFVLMLLIFAEVRGLRQRLREGRHWYDLSPASANARRKEGQHISRNNSAPDGST